MLGGYASLYVVVSTTVHVHGRNFHPRFKSLLLPALFLTISMHGCRLDKICMMGGDPSRYVVVSSIVHVHVTDAPSTVPECWVGIRPAPGLLPSRCCSLCLSFGILTSARQFLLL